MKNLSLADNFFLATIFCAPLYLVGANLFYLPTNILEILMLLNVLFFLFAKKTTFSSPYSFPKTFLASLSFIIVGLLLSILSNHQYKLGFGILKGWFIIPIFFAFVGFTRLNSISKLTKLLQTIYYSAATVAVIALIYKVLGVTTYDGRLTAFYSSPNYLAMYLAPGVFIGFYLLTNTQEIKKQPQLKLWRAYNLFFVNLLLFLFILASLFFTYSYAAWFSVILALLLTALFVFPRKKRLQIIIISALIFVALFVSQINSQKLTSLITHSNRSSLSSRQMIWEASFLMLKQHPLVGIGPGNFQNVYLALQPFFPPYLEWAVPQPHNLFLAFWLQTGILGLSGFIILLVYVLLTLGKILRNKKNAALAAPLFAFFIYILLHGLVDTPYWKNDLAMLFWIFVICVLVLAKSELTQKQA